MGWACSRTMAAAIEAHNDENGIVWPINIAPFEVAIIVANMKDESRFAAQEPVQQLEGQGIDVLHETGKSGWGSSSRIWT